MGNIYKRGKIWYLDVRCKGRRIRRRVGTSKKIAELALKDAEVQVARDEFGFSQNDIDAEKFFNEFLDYSRANHQPSTTNRYRAVIDHFRKYLKGREKIVFLSEVTSEEIDKYKLFRKDAWVNPNGIPVESDDDINDHTRKGARAHTINFEVSTLKTVFNLAIKWGYLRENPCKGVKRLKAIDSKSFRYLSIEESRRFLEACPTDLYSVYFTFLNTGMRKAELENLEWSDIDLKRRKIRIRRKETWQPKTGERDIPIGQHLYDLLIKLKSQNDRKLKSNYVFPDSTGGKIKTKLREKLVQIAKSAGIENFTKVHTLRHTFASHLVMQGVDLPTVQKLMGHADIQTTMIYAHLAPDHLANAVEKLPF
ncbi:MAG: site-specific integrase [candidate division Zixibacteria bacterium]|nr:site-specific integrase [candidate division Zixibacteria bacterium]